MESGNEKDIARLESRVDGLEERDRQTYAKLKGLKERADCIEEKAGDVDSMVHGDGGNSGLIARVNTLESKVTMLMWLLPLVGSLVTVGAYMLLRLVES